VLTNKFTFSSWLTARPSCSFKGLIVVVLFVSSSVLLHVSCMLLVARLWGILVTEFIFIAVSVSYRALMLGRKAMLYVLCRNVRSVLRCGIRRPFEGEEFELYLNIQLVPRSKHSVSVTQVSHLMLYRE
jgi:hypothetical protein